MRPWLLPARRSARIVEATASQITSTGAAGGWTGDAVDSEIGWKPAGQARREVPAWTREKAVMFSVAGYRSNPMARAIIDTYVAFAVGDKGVSYQVTNDLVRVVVDEWWNDPRNNIGGGQELGLRSNMLLGETAREIMEGAVSGVIRYSPLDPTAVTDVVCKYGNANWPDTLHFAIGGDTQTLTVVAHDDASGLRSGQALFWAPNKTLETDVRSVPFLMPILDQLDAYETVISNLIDRTSIARHIVWDVTVEGGPTEINNFVTERGGKHVPRSGTVEVHNAGVTWEPKYVQTGAYEDSAAARSVLTMVAGGAGLAKHWIAEPEDTNRATSLTMAEPVRRRVNGVQKVWLGYQTEFARLAVDRAVAARRLPRTVEARDPKTGRTYQIPASQCVTVTGPEVAAADSQITAKVLLNLATGLDKLVQIGALSKEAAAIAARRAWEDYVGVPWTADLSGPDANPDDVATHVDDPKGKKQLRAV